MNQFFNFSDESDVNVSGAPKLLPKSEIKTITDEAEIEEILKEFHNSPVGGHQGVYRTIQRLKSYYYFPKMCSRVRNFISKCESCQKNKSRRSIKTPMKITTTSRRAFEKIFLDIVGPFSKSNSNNMFLLTLQDDLTKYSLAVPLENQTAEVVA